MINDETTRVSCELDGLHSIFHNPALTFIRDLWLSYFPGQRKPIEVNTDWKVIIATMDLSSYTPEYLAADQSQTLINVAIAFAVLDTFFMASFFFSRYKCHIPLGLNGWLLVPGFLLCLTHCVNDIRKRQKLHISVLYRNNSALKYANSGLAALVLVKFGHAGRHVVTANHDQITTWFKSAVVAGYTYIASTSFPKLAFLCLYLKLITQKLYRNLTYATMGVIVLSNIIFIIVASTDCTPFAYKWDKKIPNGHCLDQLAIYRWANMPNLITDLVTIFLPLPTIWRLHTSRAQKIGLTITFLIGCT